MSGDILCPQCNTANPAGSAFCDNCGFSMQNMSPPAVSSAGVAAPSMGGGACVQCGYGQNPPGAAFCENCGAPQQAGGGGFASPVAPPVQPQPPVTPYAPPQPAYPSAGQGVVSGRFVVAGTNANIAIPAKPIVIIGREDPVSNVFPEIDLESLGGMNSGVGRQHAQLQVQGGQVVLIDMNTVNGTFVNKQKLIPSQPRPLSNGDEVRLGKFVMTYYSS